MKSVVDDLPIPGVNEAPMTEPAEAVPPPRSLGFDFKFVQTPLAVKKKIPSMYVSEAGKDGRCILLRIRPDLKLGTFNTRKVFMSEFRVAAQKLQSLFEGMYVGFDQVIDPFGTGTNYIMDPANYEFNLADMCSKLKTSDTSLVLQKLTAGQNVVKLGLARDKVNGIVTRHPVTTANSFNVTLLRDDFFFFDIANNEALSYLLVKWQDIRAWVSQVDNDSFVLDSDYSVLNKVNLGFTMNFNLSDYSSLMDSSLGFRLGCYPMFENLVQKHLITTSQASSKTFTDVLRIIRVRIGTFDTDDDSGSRVLSGDPDKLMRSILSTRLSGKWFEMDYGLNSIESGDLPGIVECLLMPLIGAGNLLSDGSWNRCFNYFYNNFLLNIDGVRSILSNKQMNRYQIVRNSDRDRPTMLFEMITLLLTFHKKNKAMTDWLRALLNWFSSAMDKKNFVAPINQSGRPSAGKQFSTQSGYSTGKVLHSNWKNIYVAPSAVSPSSDDVPQKVIEFQKLVDLWPKISVSLQGANTATNLKKMLRSIAERPSWFRSYSKGLESLVQRLAIFPLTGMTPNYGESETIVKSLVPFKPMDFLNLVLASSFEENRNVRVQYPTIMSGWSMAEAISGLMQGISDGLSFEPLELMVDPTFLQRPKSEYMPILLGHVSRTTSYTNLFKSLLMETNDFDSILSIAKKTVPRNSVIQSASYILANPAAFGFTRQVVWSPSYINAYTDPVSHVSKFVSSSLTVDTEERVTLTTDDILKGFEATKSLVKPPLIHGLHKASAGNLVLVPDLALDVLAPLVEVSEDASLGIDLPLKDLLNLFSDGVSPPVKVAFEWVGGVPMYSSLSYLPGERVSSTTFPFGVLFFDPPSLDSWKAVDPFVAQYEDAQRKNIDQYYSNKAVLPKKTESSFDAAFFMPFTNKEVTVLSHFNEAPVPTQRVANQ